MPVERHADLPRPRKGLGILDGGLIHEGVGATRRVAFSHLKGVAVEIARTVELGLAVQIRHRYHQGVAFPMPVGPAHPAIRRSLGRLIHIDRPHRACEFIRDHDRAHLLDNLERIRHVR